MRDLLLLETAASQSTNKAKFRSAGDKCNSEELNRKESGYVRQNRCHFKWGGHTGQNPKEVKETQPQDKSHRNGSMHWRKGKEANVPRAEEGKGTAMARLGRFWLWL
jgi:hypothetical protein